MAAAFCLALATRTAVVRPSALADDSSQVQPDHNSRHVYLAYTLLGEGKRHNYRTTKHGGAKGRPPVKDGTATAVPYVRWVRPPPPPPRQLRYDAAALRLP